uniref:Uncharacterized protein n=1 Tax=Romanomermis culicivorax TaxID=13658 RepID=A0A915IJK9_ROMCU
MKVSANIFANKVSSFVQLSSTVGVVSEFKVKFDSVKSIVVSFGEKKFAKFECKDDEKSTPTPNS